MIALRPIIALLAVFVGPAVALYILFGRGEPTPIDIAVAGLFILVSAALARRAVIDPLRALSFWRDFARENGYEFFGNISREPVVKGVFGDRRFVAGLSTMLAPSDANERYRTVVSCPVERGVPAGFRVYGRRDPTWVHDESGKREVSTGDSALQEAVVCEGQDAQIARKFILEPDHREAILALIEVYPALLIHGAESAELPAEPGGASGVVTIALEGRVQNRDELREHIERVASLAEILDE